MNFFLADVRQGLGPYLAIYLLGRAFSARCRESDARHRPFQFGQGTVITAQGFGAALSTSLAGLVVVRAGFSAAFLALAGIAASGFLLYFLGMPERGISTPPRQALSQNEQFPNEPGVKRLGDSRDVFVLTYAGVALGRAPGLLIDRAGITLAVPFRPAPRPFGARAFGRNGNS